MVDDSPEREVALKYACLCARKGGGHVALLQVVEPTGLTPWAGVDVMTQEERREKAEKLQITGDRPILPIREGDPREELLALLEEDPRISVLVLASAAAGSGPGPLITALSGRYSGRLVVPMTIVPGTLDDEALDRVT